MVRQQNCPSLRRAAEITSSDRGDWQPDDWADGVLLGSRNFALYLMPTGESGSVFFYIQQFCFVTERSKQAKANLQGLR